jgi:hypothetical protein
MRFLVDHCISHRVCKAIAVLTASGGEVNIHALKDQFPINISDQEFLKKLAEDGDWCLISQDVGMPAHSVRLRLVAESGTILFLLDGKWGNRTIWDKSGHLITWWPFMQQLAVPANASKLFNISGAPNANPPLFPLPGATF